MSWISASSFLSNSGGVGEIRMKTCAILIVCFCVVAYGGFAKTIRVPDDCPTIQGAIDAAGPGDVILLSEGVGAEQWGADYRWGTHTLYIRKSLTLRGQGTSRSVLWGGLHASSYPYIIIEGAIDVVIEDVFLKCDESMWISPQWIMWGGGPWIRIKGTAHVKFENIKITNYGHDHRWGNGIEISDSADVEINAVDFSSVGRAVRASGSANLSMTNCTISAGYGGVEWYSSATLKMANSSIIGFQIPDRASPEGVSIGSGRAEIEDCDISSCAEGVRISFSECTLRNAVVHSNTGTGIRSQDSSLKMSDCEIRDNGAGVICSSLLECSRGMVKAEDCTIENNEENGVSLEAAEGVISNCRILGNEAGISLDGTARAIITDNIVKNNDGWGIAARRSAVAVGWGNTVTGNQRDLFGVSDWLIKPRQPSDRATIVVPREAPTVGEAIYRVAEGGTIVVESGDYSHERVAIYKRINIEGQGHGVILGGISLFNELGNVHVSNLTIVGDTDNVGILVPNGNHFQLEDSVISNWDTGLRLLPGSTATVWNCTISENDTGIRDSSSALVLRGCSMSLNGDQAISSSSEELRIEECSIVDNGKDGDYAAIRFSGKDAYIKDSVIEGNNSFGVEVGSGSCDIESCSISENGAGVDSSGTLVISGSRIMNNRVYGIYASRGDVTVISTEVALNRYGVFLADGGEYIENLVGRNICIRDNSSANLRPSIEQYPWPAEFEECVQLDEVSEPPLIEDFYADVTGEGEATLSWTYPVDLELSRVVVRRSATGWPTDHTDGILVHEDLIPEAGSKAEYMDTDLVAGRTYYYAVFTSDFNENWNDRVEQGKNAAAVAIPPAMEDSFPNCVLQLRGKASRLVVTEVCVGTTFEIYVGSSDDDSGIEGVRFSSDEPQDGNPTGEWTDWYDWDISSGDWDAETKTMAWTFTTSGKKEVWAEVRDQAGESTKCYAPIYANPVKEPSKKFEVGEYTRIKKSPSASVWEEPRADSKVLCQVWHRTPAKILPNEDNGSYADGYAWWYVETKSEEKAFPLSGWCREIDLEKNVLPTASFTYTLLAPRCGEDVVLNARASGDSDGEIVAWRWKLNGAGGYTTNPEIVYYWDKPGEYSVTLEVEDDTRGTDRITKTISVNKKSLWEKLKDLFGSVARLDSERLKEIKRELLIKNWSQEIPIYDPDPLNPFYNYSDGDLATVLIQEMDKENAPGLTYGTYILDSIREKNLVRMASRGMSS
jgi:parallel beta-helix repeat protein